MAGVLYNTSKGPTSISYCWVNYVPDVTPKTPKEKTKACPYTTNLLHVQSVGACVNKKLTLSPL